MRQMKDSGIEWIGQIPEEWEVKKVGNCYSERNIKVSDKDYPPLSVTQKGILPQLDSAAKTDNGENRKLICSGDFVINSRSDRKGSCGISQFTGSTSLINIVITAKQKINNNYFSFVFKSNMFSNEFFKWGNGIVDDLWSTKWSSMKKISIPFPPLNEQQRIADYLDTQCACIDETMELVRQSREKLRAYKLSLITEAVTKGLDPDVPMKDSGVPWIGEIPAGWKCVQLKRAVVSVKTGSTPKGAEEKYYAETGVKWFTPADFTTFPYIDDSAKKLSDLGRCEVKIFPQNSVLLIGIGATMGKVALANSPYSANQQINSIQCRNNLLPLFLTFYISTITEYLFKCGKFTTLPILNQEETKNIYIPLPPLSEQQRIAAYLDEKCARIDALLAKKDELLDKLAEYRKSLIFECVTGKREVAA